MKYIFSLFSLMILILSGCSDYRELDTVDIVTGISLNKVGNVYEVGFQIVNPNEIAGSSTSRPEVIVFKSKTLNYQDIYQNIGAEIPQFLDFSHLALIVVGESLAKENLLRFNDLFDRNILFNPSAQLVVSKGIDPILFLTTQLTDGRISSVLIRDLLQSTYKNYGTALPSTIEQFVILDGLQGVSPVTQAVTINSTKTDKELLRSDDDFNFTLPMTRLKIDGVGVFKDEKLLGYLSPRHVISINIVKKNLEQAFMKVQCGPNDYNRYRLHNFSNKLSSEIKEKKVFIHSKLKVDATLLSSQCSTTLTTDYIKKLEKELEKTIKNHFIESHHLVQSSFGTDVFGYGELVRRQHRKDWQKMKREWDAYFSTANFTIEVDAAITGVGLKNVKLSDKTKIMIDEEAE